MLVSEKTPITIVDYGMGNLASIRNMLSRVGQVSLITSDKGAIASARKLILPGVGSFDTAMTNIEKLGLREILDQKVLKEAIPTLGICLGMQLMTRRSEEGALSGLGWIPAETIKFRFDPSMGRLPVPHMGWNTARATRNHPVFDRELDQPRFYFVHSYYVRCDSRENVLTDTDYGHTFTSAVCRDNIVGVQFHPEKSHRFGMALLRNFSECILC